jgi:hypothetical protein
LWTVVYIADSKSSAERMMSVLRDGGLLASVRPSVPEACDGMFEVLVTECEAEEAQEVMRARLSRLPAAPGVTV